ncbi:hypothetical protein JX266_007569 [Neoarthrinium moseri]|uniref:uncharacterized protein n=1 Tax=Neoarthrinium moseri TaxID=1658444 RepID=UPI001FDD9AA8|nr:uncharacterized protein JN550_008937 [Neoarthrinium moseri]KAI1846364.1 hypothetical protein JX266_007569 [Neoarthrinium moseri]KAI1864380.1 hypothetical protein JN550_008937 [Neoarthrinium moseri]
MTGPATATPAVTSPASNDNNTNMHGLAGGAIAGVVVGGVIGGAVMAGALVWYVLGRRPRHSETSQAHGWDHNIVYSAAQSGYDPTKTYSTMSPAGELPPNTPGLRHELHT